MTPGLMGGTCRSLLAILCSFVLAPGDTLAYTPQQSPAFLRA